MFIQTEQTPNPATLKFLPGCPVMTAGTANFTSEQAAHTSPLAERLFFLPEVTGVFLGADFVTVTKNEEGDWYRLKPAILAVIMEHFTTGRPVLLSEPAVGESAEAAQDEEDEVHDFQDGVVYLHMQGSCSGCPSSTATLKAGIENMLRHYIPEVVEVRAV